MQGHGSCKSEGFIGPFRGWCWHTDGKCAFLYGRHMFSEQQLDGDDPRRPEAKVEEWIGCAFIGFDRDAPSIREPAGPVAAGLDAYNADTMRGMAVRDRAAGQLDGGDGGLHGRLSRHA